VKALRTAILVGAAAAVVTWAGVYFAVHEPASRQMPDGSILIICGHNSDDADLTAMLWAGVAYIVAFTSTLLLLQEQTPKHVFATRKSIG